LPFHWVWIPGSSCSKGCPASRKPCLSSQSDEPESTSAMFTLTCNPGDSGERKVPRVGCAIAVGSPCVQHAPIRKVGETNNIMLTPQTWVTLTLLVNVFCFSKPQVAYVTGTTGLPCKSSSLGARCATVSKESKNLRMGTSGAGEIKRYSPAFKISFLLTSATANNSYAGLW